MARYYFDTHNRTQSIRDDDGADFESLDAAMQAAACSAAEIGTNEVLRGRPSDVRVVVEIRNEQNQRICSVTAAMTIEWHAPRP